MTQARAEIRQRIRDAGLRITPSRVAVMALLVERAAPMTHAEVVEALVADDFDRATLYRNLRDLADAGLLSRQDVGDHLWRFEAKAAGDLAPHAHPHFVCTECGDVVCLDSAPTFALSDKVGRVSEVVVKGVCADCD